MKKIFISAVMACSALAISAQSYLINDKLFDGSTHYAGYNNASFTLAGSAAIQLNLIQSDFEAIDGSSNYSQEGNDGKTGGQYAIRIGDSDKGGSVSFTVPAGTSVGTVRIHFRGKGKFTANDRIAILSINGTDEPAFNGLDSDSPGIFQKEYNQILDSDLTFSLRAGNTDPIMLNSIQVTEYSSSASVGDVKADGRVVAAYYNLLGTKLSDEPAKGLFIEVYTDGTSQKILK